MPDPYALDSQVPSAPPRSTTVDALRAFLWTLLALSVGGNALTSFTTMPVWVSLSFGLVSASTIAALVVLHRRGR